MQFLNSSSTGQCRLCSFCLSTFFSVLLEISLQMSLWSHGALVEVYLPGYNIGASFPSLESMKSLSKGTVLIYKSAIMEQVPVVLYLGKGSEYFRNYFNLIDVKLQLIIILICISLITNGLANFPCDCGLCGSPFLLFALIFYQYRKTFKWTFIWFTQNLGCREIFCFLSFLFCLVLHKTHAVLRTLVFRSIWNLLAFDLQRTQLN